MVWLVIIGVLLATVAVYAYWPRKGGIVDKNIREAKARDIGKGGRGSGHSG